MTEEEGRLEEYRTLRAEILQNDALMQRICMFGYFAVVLPFIPVSFSYQNWIFLFLPPFAYLFFQQLYIHKLEGTIRIATYIATHLEPNLPGFGWEAKIRRISVGLPGIASYHVLGLIAFFGSGIGLVLQYPGPYLALILLAFATLYGLCLVQWHGLKRLSGPEGYRRAWEELKP